MICDKFIHIGFGSVNDGAIRGLFARTVFGKRFSFYNDIAHLEISLCERSIPEGLPIPPSFTFVRNPWDWYLSYYFTELKYHRWRGSFRDWFFNRKKPIRFREVYDYFTESRINYTGRFENMEEDLIWIFTKINIIPDMITECDVRGALGIAGQTYVHRPWVEGTEQWIRHKMFDYDMLEEISLFDGELIKRYEYTFDDYYYHPGGRELSGHSNIDKIDFENEKNLARWVNWVPGPPVVFSKMGERLC